MPEPDPAVDGYVTRASSLTDFDVNGYRIFTNAKTVFKTTLNGPEPATRSGGNAFFGEAVAVFGKIDDRHHTITATEVLFRQPRDHRLSGFAVIDRILATKQGELLVRADGYLIRINASTQTTFQAPCTSLAEVKPNVWLKYHGTLHSDGVLVADAVTFQPNVISDSEDKLLAKNDYDPSTVPADSKQNVVKKYFLGIDPKKIPPYKDPVMQARINHIGASLIPSFQRTLAKDDESRIFFQFQLIDDQKFHDALTLPNGIILVPYQIISRLQNDSQVAAVLADNIVQAIEKQNYRAAPERKKLIAAEIASGAFGLSGLGIGALVKDRVTASMQRDAEDQSGRVSLGLLHDAGYDIQQAPVAWWLLAAKPKKALTSTPLPPRASNLYRTIGLVWQNYPDTTQTQSSPSATASPATAPTS